jgi:peptidoglycan/LPS O-acetylase OafA/YrhL
MLTVYDWVYGSGQIASVVLSLVAGIMAISMLKQAHKRKQLRAWPYLLWALVFFALEECVGALKTFGVWSTPWMTHVIPSFILAFLITALVIQIQVTKGYD